MQQLLVAGRYRLLELVGSGGMGRVWLARDEMLHRDVAVKEVVPPNWLDEAERDELRLRTLREARTAARLNHPNVVRLYDVVHDRDSPWIVMEYVPSRSVQQILTADGPLQPGRVAGIGLAVLAALRAAHAAGVLHRDVKPHNVLVADDGRVMLTDFGLATFDGGDGLMTGPGLVLGSPQFVAPERARDGVSDPRTDLWSLGATLYAAVEGQSPYARSTAMATLSALATEPPDPVRRAGPLRPVLEGLLQRDPWRRLTAVEADRLLRAALAAADGGLPLAGRRPEAIDRPASHDTRPTTPDPRTRPGGVPAALPASWEAGRPAAGDASTPTDAPRPTDAPAGGGGERAGPPAPGDADVPRAAAVPAPVVAPRRGGARRRRQRLVAVAVASTLLVGAGVAAALRGGGDRASPSPGGGGGATAVRPVAFPCGTPAPAGATPVPSVPPPAGEPALVAGWTWYEDATGFRIAAPARWLRFTDGTVTCFREPGGRRVLSVAPGAAPADPVAHWRAEERRLTGDGALPGYHRVDISRLDMFRGGALWECSWLNAADVQVHTARLIVAVAAGRAYTVSWLTEEFDWQVNATYFLMIRQSFRPAA
ncbi:Serine/threonine protein kinase [Micromonospora purpureochromogenes]|uniref:non-specific serine/threonine protein kinase n=1 Tax=Micromonospora purpureochromogenes TaxID=47872 RepID=A0A1C4XID0_9ACTN|nr:serine/threonine-protein kinase [Micromonospora purpureochromogenes]SCF08207.1 Serine/threonine protein kinase [Micromonospora purpureochromogenes]